MIGLTKTTVNSGKVIWQRVIQLAQGGFVLNDSVITTAGQLIEAGVPIYFDEATRLAKVAKVAVVHEAANNTATTYKVKKGHNLAVGMTVTCASGDPYAITGIVATDPNYDAISVGTTLGQAVAIGDAIYVDDDAISNPKGLLYADVELNANGDAEIAVALSATIYARRVIPIPAVIREKLPLIIFSESY